MAKKTKTETKTPKSKKAKPQERGLGRGLSALMADVNMDVLTSEDVVPVDAVEAPSTDADMTDDVLIYDDIMDIPNPADDRPESSEPAQTPPTEDSAKESNSAPAPVATPAYVGTYAVPGYTPAQLEVLTEAEFRDLINADANFPEDQRDAYEAIATEKMYQEYPNTPRDMSHKTPKKAPPPSDHNTKSGVAYVEMGQLERNPEQPRRYFDGSLIDELAESIRQKGVLQPILVRPVPDKVRRNKPVYQVIAGERRWQAAMHAKLDAMPVFVREITDQEALEIGVIENVQREDLNPMEEALAYRALIDQFGRRQEDVAEAVGKSRSYVANMLRLIKLPEEVQDYLASGDISTGHARAIIAAPDPVDMAREIVEHDLSVRDAEEWARRLKDDMTAQRLPTKKAPLKGADERRLEAELMDVLGLPVDLKHRGPGGELRIKYKNGDQLDDLIARFMR